MDLSPAVKVAIIMSNYFHDVATAVLLAAAVIMWVLGRHAEKGGPAEVCALAGAYPALTKFAWGAIAWIVIGGIPRTIFFSAVEWDQAQVKGLTAALGVKHAFMGVAVVAGILLWRRMAKVAGRIASESR